MKCHLVQPNPKGWKHMRDVYDINRAELLYLNPDVIRRYMEEHWAQTGKWLRKTRQDEDNMKPLDTFSDVFDTIQRLHAAFDGQRGGTAGTIRVMYRRAKRCKFGRLYAYMQPTGPSIQMLNKILRRWVTSTVLRDFDFRNCHPSILFDLCERHGIDAPLLRAYVRDPTPRRFEIGEDGKMRVLAAIYMEKDRTRSPWLIDFAAEMDRVEAALELVYHEDYARMSHKYDGRNLRGAFMAAILQQYEAGLLHVVTEHVKTWGVDIVSYVFDGFMIRKHLEGGSPEGTDANLPEDFLARLNALVREAGFPSVVLEEKPIEPVDFEQYALQRGMAWRPVREGPERAPIQRIENADIDALLGERGVVQIDASMCSGKSHQMRRVIVEKRRAGLSVVIVTSRQLLATGWVGELLRMLGEFRHDLTFYKDRSETKFNPGSNPILVVEHESIHNVDVGGYDLVIFDEVRSGCSTIVSKTNGTNGSKIRDHHDLLRELVVGARWVIGLDADIKVDGAVETLMQTFADWRGEEVRKYEHQGGVMDRAVRMQDPDVLVAIMCRQARAGEVFGVCCGSKMMAKRLYAMLVKIVGADKVLLYTREDGDASDLRDVNAHWKGRIVIFTSRITTGIDFEGEVACVYVFPCALTAAPREMWQMTGRFRTVASGVIWLACKEVTAAKASSPMLRSDVDTAYNHQFQPLERSDDKMERDRATATEKAVAVVSADHLTKTLDWKVSTLLKKLAAYDRAERHVTKSPVAWIRYFKYMARLKTYTVFDDYASRPRDLDTSDYDAAKDELEELEDFKMEVVDVAEISDDMYESLESLGQQRFIKRQAMADLFASAQKTGVTPAWNHLHAYNKARIKRLYPDIAPDAITPASVSVLDRTFSKRYHVKMVEVGEGLRHFIGLRERTESSIPNLVPGTGVMLHDMHRLAVAIGLDNVLDMDTVPDTTARVRELDAAIAELRRGSSVPCNPGPVGRFVKEAFVHVFGIDVTFKTPNQFSKAYRTAEELAPLRMDAILREKMGGVKVRAHFETPAVAELPALRQLAEANGGEQGLVDYVQRLQAQAAASRGPDRETCAANKRKHDEMIASMHEERISALRGRARDRNGEGTTEVCMIRELCCDSCFEWLPKEAFKLKFDRSRWYRGEFTCPGCDSA